MNPTRTKRKLGVAPLHQSGLDIAICLVGRPADCRAGNCQSAGQASPPGYWLLPKHPLAFISAALVWTSLLCPASMMLPTTLAEIPSLALAIGLAWGSALWFGCVLGVDWNPPAVLALAATPVA